MAIYINGIRQDGAGAGGAPDPHESTHRENGSDEIIVENLGTAGASGYVPASDGLGGLTMTAPSGGAPDAHATSHEEDGSDELFVEALGTAGTSGQVPTSDGLGGLTMETPVDTGEVNTSSNDGTGEGLAKAKDGVDLPFKSLTGSTHVVLSSDTNEVNIDGEPTGTTVNAATFTVLTSHATLEVDYTTTGTCTITIDTDNAVAGRRFFICDTGGNAQTNNVTVNTEGTEEINGETSAIMAGNFESWEVYSDGTDFFIR